MFDITKKTPKARINRRIIKWFVLIKTKKGANKMAKRRKKKKGKKKKGKKRRRRR